MDILTLAFFAVSRSTWRLIAAEAYKFFVENIAACKYHDQSALNAVVGKRRLRFIASLEFSNTLSVLGH